MGELRREKVARPNDDGAERQKRLHQEIRDMVADTAPRVFAVVEEYETESGEMDAWVAGWGLAYEDGRAHVNATAANLHLSLRSPDRAAALLGLAPGVDTYLIWPDAS